MKQLTLSTAGFDKHSKTPRRAVCLADRERVVAWADLCTLIAPVYPKAGERGGRPPVGLERMLRIYFLQQGFTLRAPACKKPVIQASRLNIGTPSSPKISF